MTMASTMPMFRHATTRDLDGIEGLLTRSGLPTAGVREIVASDPAAFVVALSPADATDVVAVAGLETCCNNALLRSVAVDPAWQRRGLGQELVREVVSRAEARGLRALYLLTMTAEHYFPRFGFERVERGDVPQEIAETEEFREACPVSAVAMCCTLPAGSGARSPA
jgi:amino-acid N-acetyltransferase